MYPTNKYYNSLNTNDWFKLLAPESKAISVLQDFFGPVTWTDQTDKKQNVITAFECQSCGGTLPYNYQVQAVTNEEGDTSISHIFEIAAAGYTKDRIKVKTVNTSLVVDFERLQKEDSTESTEEETEKKEVIYPIQKGIKNSSVKMAWTIKNLNNSTITQCDLKDGILTIIVKENKPVSQTREIAIG